jgi:UDP-N-acetylmuramoyl-tripeptide--D-alanyl-D-alanine ligase
MKKIFKIIVQVYLKLLTRVVLFRHKPFVIAVAGTTNKTFVKETILDELGRDENVRGNPKSFNTEIGLPLAVLFLPSGFASVFRWVDVLLTGTCISIFSRKFPKILVLEMGVDRVGDMEYLLSLVKPKIAIITDVKRDFPGIETTLDEIAKEFALLAREIPADGMLILNGDDIRTKNLEKVATAKTVVFGEDKNFDAVISDIKDSNAGQKFALEYGKKKDFFNIERHGRHNIDALVIAKIVANELDRNKLRNK